MNKNNVEKTWSKKMYLEVPVLCRWCNEDLICNNITSLFKLYQASLSNLLTRTHMFMRSYVSLYYGGIVVL